MAKQKVTSTCGTPLDPDNPGSYYCEFVWNDGQWDLVGASHPHTSCYCTDPSQEALKVGEHFYNYPCCNNEKTLKSANTTGRCYGIYRFQEGRFLVVDAVSAGEVGCPTDLERYSRANRDFSFAATIEFHDVPCRATYEYSNGAFTLIDETPAGSCRGTERENLGEYSKTHRGFYFFETIKFTED